MWQNTNMTHLNAFVIKVSSGKIVKKVDGIYNSSFSGAMDSCLFFINAAASSEEQGYLPIYAISSGLI